MLHALEKKMESCNYTMQGKSRKIHLTDTGDNEKSNSALNQKNKHNRDIGLYTIDSLPNIYKINANKRKYVTENTAIKQNLHTE